MRYRDFGKHRLIIPIWHLTTWKLIRCSRSLWNPQSQSHAWHACAMHVPSKPFYLMFGIPHSHVQTRMLRSPRLLNQALVGFSFICRLSWGCTKTYHPKTYAICFRTHMKHLLEIIADQVLFVNLCCTIGQTWKQARDIQLRIRRIGHKRHLIQQWEGDTYRRRPMPASGTHVNMFLLLFFFETSLHPWRLTWNIIMEDHFPFKMGDL